jgi:mono/diheme cytochrome c family protein
MSAALCAILAAALLTTGALARDTEWTAPSDAAARANPLAARPALAAGGRKIFSQRCVECHGADARGSDRAPDLTAAEVQAQTDGALFWKISTGNTRVGMPSFSFLPQAQRWQLVLALRGRLGAG